MSNFLRLMKVNLLEQLKINKIMQKKDQSKKILALLGIIMIVLFVFGYVGILFYGIAEISKDQFGSEYLLSTGFLVSSVMLIFFTVTRANAYLFRSRDFDLLVSLPINLSTVILAKISSFLLMGYLTLAVIFIPLLVVYLMFFKASIVFLSLYLLIFLLLPLLIITVLSFVSYVLSMLLSRFKYKNIVAIIGSILLVVGIMVLSYGSSGSENSNEALADVIIMMSDKLKLIYYPAYLAKAALTGEYLALLSFVVISVIPFGLFVYLTGKIYVKINTALNRLPKSKTFDNEKIVTKQTNTIRLLLKNEVKRYVGIPIYATNTIIGKLLMPIMIVIMYTQFNAIEEVGISGDVIMLIVTLIAVFSLGMTSVTSVAISIEGKNFWIVKSSPISPKQVFISKMLLEFILSMIFGIITIIIVAVLIKPGILVMALFTAIIVLMSAHNSVLGLLINLRFPKMNWDLPVHAVKQGVSVLLNMTIGMVIDVLLVVLGVLILNATNNFYLVYTMVIGLLTLCVLIEWFLLKKHGNRLYNKIPA